jgi:hypothetical protein
MKVTFDEKTHTYTVDGIFIPSVTQIIQACISSFYKYDNNNRNLDIGKKVHFACELYDQDNLDEKALHTTLVPYLEQWKKFKQDFQVDIQEIELIVFSEKYRYAGTIDRIAEIVSYRRKKKVIIEIKTGSVGYAAIQTAGYQIAYQSIYKKNIERMAVVLNPENYKVQEFNSIQDKQVFLACLTLYNYQKEVR